MSLQKTTLPSGLTVITDSMPDVASVSLGLWFNVGTRHESLQQTGLSHLLEHMFFKGTLARDAKTMNRTIEAVGGSLNAYTAREQTAYTARVLAADVPLALELIAEMMLQPRFDVSDLEKEKSVIAQEIGEAYDAPDDWIFDLFHTTAYPGQALGMPTLGTTQSLAPLKAADLRSYVASHYNAPRAVLAAAGAVDHGVLVELVKKHLATLPTAKGTPIQPAMYKGGDALEDRDIEQLHLCFGLEGVGITEPHFIAQTLFALMLGGGTSSRLFHEVREERALAYSVSAFSSPYQDTSQLLIYAAADPERAQEASALILKETAALAAAPSTEELDRAKAQAIASLLMELESTGARAERVAMSHLQHGRVISTDELRQKIQRVTPADIITAAQLLLKKPLTRTAVGPIAALESFDKTKARLAA
jgi:predicted Zn-dependent peptidase